VSADGKFHADLDCAYREKRRDSLCTSFLMHDAEKEEKEKNKNEQLKKKERKKGGPAPAWGCRGASA